MARACPKCGKSFPDSVFFCGFDGTITVEEQDFRNIDPRVGAQIADYILVARVADGAMGRIYEGRHVNTRKRVAIKVLHESVAGDEVAVERFRREYDTAKTLNHDNVLRVLDFGEASDRTPFIVMEYLEGQTLRGALDRDGVFPAARWLRIAAQTALALEHAHSFGVIHRDLKPENIILCLTEAGDEVRLLDFGSVKLQIDPGMKLTQLGTTIGSPYYMSPEQAMGLSDLDARSDVFALAAIIYEMATGKIAFEGSDIAQIMMKVIQGERPRISETATQYSRHLDDALHKGLHHDKNQRPQSTIDLVQQIASAVGVELSVEKIAVTQESQLRPRAVPSIVPLTKSKSDTPKSTPIGWGPGKQVSRPAPSVAPMPAAPTSWSPSLIPPKRSNLPVALTLVALGIGALLIIAWLYAS